MLNNSKSLPITVTQSALDRIKHLIKERGNHTLGIKIGVKAGGCTGLSYVFEYVDIENAKDEKLQFEDISLYIDNKALLYLVGTKLDFIEKDLESGFIFVNPNAKGSCGCGESFYV